MRLALWIRVVLDVVLPEHNASSVHLEMLRKFRTLQVAKISETRNMNGSSVIFRLSKNFRLWLHFLEVQAGILCSLFHSLSKAALASGIFTASFMERVCAPGRGGIQTHLAFECGLSMWF